MASLDLQLKPSVQKLGTEVVKAEVELNFASQNATTSDTVGALTLPAGAVLVGAMANVKTVEGGTATVDIGIRGGSATAFHSNLDAETLADTFLTTQNYVNDSGDEEIVIITPDADLDAAVIQLIMIYAVSELTL